jgi:ATP-dependent Clp protease ATP-binding subunit ClpA
LRTERRFSCSRSVLKQVATHLNRLPPEPAFGLEPVVEQLAELLTGRRPRGVLLVGPSGVGKTTAVRELVRLRKSHNLGSTPFWATSGARLVAGMCGYGMWQQRCEQVIREASRKGAILHLGSLVELMHVGKSEHQTTGVAAFLRPYLARGELLAVAECTPEQIPIIEREDPHLLDAFQRLSIAEPDAAQGRAILAQAAAAAPPTGGLTPRRSLSEEALLALDRLHRRYATYSAYPGRPLRFLRNLLRDHSEATIAPADVLAAFARETGLPRAFLDPEQPLDLALTRTWFCQRVLDQEEAVDLLVDLLATVKADLTRPRKPIASLLFIGPTGVGKTEMAKALAEFLFGSKQRLTRFDMSEYTDPISVQRLVGGLGDQEGLLTARVREQPFSVVLLDEFEKAHPQVFDLLLQVLGEGRLTDAAGRLADFNNAVIILTSNLGAETFQRGGFGFGDEVHGRDLPGRRSAAREHFVQAVRAFLRPEMFNRIDRVVPFMPLEADAVRRIAERHLHNLHRRDGLRYRAVTVDYAEGVADHLARNGFDVRYGARPLLRAVERELLAPLANQMNRYSAETALAGSVSVPPGQGSLEVKVKARTDSQGHALQAGGADTSQAESALECVQLRRSVQQLERCWAVRELHNSLFTLERVQQRYEKALQRHAARLARNRPSKAPRLSPADAQQLAQLRGLLGRLGELVRASYGLENRVLTELYGAELWLEAGSTRGETDRLRREWLDLLFTLYCRQVPQPDRLTLALFSESHALLCHLADAYRLVADRYQLQIRAIRFTLPASPQPPARAESKPTEPPDEGPQRWEGDRLIAVATAKQPERVVLERQDVVAETVRWLPEGSLGVALELSGRGAAVRFQEETGLHLIRLDETTSVLDKGLVETSRRSLHEYVPPEGITRRGAIANQTRRRTCDVPRRLVDDEHLGDRRTYQEDTLAGLIYTAMEECLQKKLQALLTE